MQPKSTQINNSLRKSAESFNRSQSKEWESKLTEMMRTIKILEGKKQEKVNAIERIKRNIKEADKNINKLQGTIEIDRSKVYSMQVASIINTKRNKEKELERKVKELEDTMIKGNNKVNRLGEINLKLIQKMKASTNEIEVHNKSEEHLKGQVKSINQHNEEYKKENELYH